MTKLTKGIHTPVMNAVERMLPIGVPCGYESQTAAPVIAQDGNSVTMTAKRGEIRYTTNGSTPTASSTKYTSAVTISADTTFKAIAIASGHKYSAVTTFEAEYQE